MKSLRNLKHAYLKTITALSLLADNIQNRVYQLGAFCVMSLGPVVSSSTLSENKVVWSEDLAEWSRADGVHGTWLQIDEDGTWHIFASGSFIVVDVDPLELKIRVSVVGTGGVDSMLV